MKKVKLGKHTLEIYESIEDLPITRFHKFNKMLLIDAGVGSDITDLDAHLERAIRFSKSKPDLTVKELENLRKNGFLIQSELNPNHLAFCTLIKTIDGVEQNDLSTEGLKKVLDLISDVSHSEMKKKTESVKKKVDTELASYFPSIFDDAKVKEYYTTLLQRTRLILDGIIEQKDNSAEVDRITTMLLMYNEPKSFSGSKSAEIIFDKQFEDMCLVIAKQLGTNAKAYTVLEYYSAFEHIKKEMKDGRR